jgi:hypothetical protein
MTAMLGQILAFQASQTAATQELMETQARNMETQARDKKEIREAQTQAAHLIGLQFAKMQIEIDAKSGSSKAPSFVANIIDERKLPGMFGKWGTC